MGGNRNPKNFTIHMRSDGRRDFYQHDDRGYSGSSKSSGSGGGGGGREGGGGGGRGNRSKYSGRGSQYYSSGSYARGYNRRGQSNYRGEGSRKYLQDDDVSMSEGKGGRHQQMYNQMRGGGSRRPRRGRGGIRINTNSGWHRIVIKDVASYSREEIIGTLKELIGDEFVPIMMEFEMRNLIFFLEKSADIAKAILNLSGRMTLGDGHKVYISCSDTTPPNRKFLKSQVEVIKVVMGERYSPEMKRLDLKHFHADKRLIREQIFCPLYRRSCLLTVFEVLISNCPDIEEIDLSSNQINSGVDLAPLKNCCRLQRMHLQRNRLKLLESLDSLKGLGITELTLEGNPLCDKFKDGDSYISGVRSLFPKVERLDGMELPKPILFEVEEEGLNLPPTLPSFFGASETIKGVVLQFLQQYFQVLESGDRSLLGAAYTEDAMFSLSAHFPDNSMSGNKYTKWIELENRNLKKATHSDKRHKLLYKGRSSIVDFLRRFPKVVHDPASFVVDIPLAQPRLMHIVLTGVFKQPLGEKSSGGPPAPVRNFMKSAIVVPVGSGFCISNEELYVNAATVEQVRRAFKEPSPSSGAATESVLGAAAGGAATSLPPAPAPREVLETEKVEMIKQFAVNSKMLPEYCKICLEQNGWDFAKAGENFLNLQKENKIPPEYFGPSLPPAGP